MEETRGWPPGGGGPANSCRHRRPAHIPRGHLPGERPGPRGGQAALPGAARPRGAAPQPSAQPTAHWQSRPHGAPGSRLRCALGTWGASRGPPPGASRPRTPGQRAAAPSRLSPSENRTEDRMDGREAGGGRRAGRMNAPQRPARTQAAQQKEADAGSPPPPEAPRGQRSPRPTAHTRGPRLRGHTAHGFRIGGDSTGSRAQHILTSKQ